MVRQAAQAAVGSSGVPESNKADIERVTRHNPPWAGKYLGYYRPPVPAHLFEPGAGRRTRSRRPDACRAPATPEPAASPPAGRPARPDRPAARPHQPRLPEELDLAEAICAVKWPKWPEYGARSTRSCCAGRWWGRSSTPDPAMAGQPGAGAGVPGGYLGQDDLSLCRRTTRLRARQTNPNIRSSPLRQGAEP